MRLRHLAVSASVLASALAAPISLRAQAGPIASIAFGSMVESGGNWRDTGHQTLDVMLAARFRFEEPTGFVLGGYAGATNKLFGTDTKSCTTSTGAECLPAFPQFKYLGLAVGGEKRSEKFGVLVFGGPGVFTSPRTRVARLGANGVNQFSDQESSRRFGVLARADFTYFLDEDFGILLGLSTRVVPSFADERLMLSGLSLGLRIR